jgi:N-formylglutamate deformylase
MSRDDAPVFTLPVFTLHRGDTPLLVSIPHAGTALPMDQHARYVPRALEVEDTDWHLDQLYGFVRDLGASLIVPGYSRYLIDLNRPPDDAPMYPGANNTELCPTHFFTGDPLYQPGHAPQAPEIERRRVLYWRPYHDALAAEIERLRAHHGHAVLFEAHSIRSVVPWLFTGTLPALNLGCADGRSCAPGLRAALAQRLQAQTTYDHVIDGRFKGGYITRHYGQPARGVHAVQLEMCMRCYMNEAPPFAIDPARAASIRPLLQALVETMIAWRPDA